MPSIAPATARLFGGALLLIGGLAGSDAAAAGFGFDRAMARDGAGGAETARWGPYVMTMHVARPRPGQPFVISGRGRLPVSYPGFAPPSDASLPFAIGANGARSPRFQSEVSYGLASAHGADHGPGAGNFSQSSVLASTPLPGALGLLAAGIGGLMALRRVRRAPDAAA